MLSLHKCCDGLEALLRLPSLKKPVAFGSVDGVKNVSFALSNQSLGVNHRLRRRPSQLSDALIHFRFERGFGIG